jgi:hypothetical protein
MALGSLPARQGQGYMIYTERTWAFAALRAFTTTLSHPDSRNTIGLWTMSEHADQHINMRVGNLLYSACAVDLGRQRSAWKHRSARSFRPAWRPS